VTETPYATGTADTAAAPGAGDAPGYAETGASGGYDGDAGALAAEGQLPARQDARDATWGDSPEYDEDGLGGEYDGDLGALAGEDQLPARQDSRDAAWGDSPAYDEDGLGEGDDGDAGALAGEDQLPARQDSRAATWGDDPGYHDEADLGDGYDGDLDALTAEGDALDSGQGDQDQAAADEAPAATWNPGDPPAEAPGPSAETAPGHEAGSVTAAESPPAGPGTGSAAETGTGERPDETAQAGQADAFTSQAAQPGDAHAGPDAAPDAGLKELKAEYEASLKDLKTELQALKDLWGPVSDAPEGAGSQADQPRLDDRKLPVDQQNTRDVERQDDRPGLWSNAKYALYGAVGTTVGMALLDQFAPGVSRVVDDIIVGVPTLVGALVPTLREGWKRKHDDSPDKR
jgi:hypothetical protein